MQDFKEILNFDVGVTALDALKKALDQFPKMPLEGEIWIVHLPKPHDWIRILWVVGKPDFIDFAIITTVECDSELGVIGAFEEACLAQPEMVNHILANSDLGLKITTVSGKIKVMEINYLP